MMTRPTFTNRDVYGIHYVLNLFKIILYYKIRLLTYIIMITNGY